MIQWLSARAAHHIFLGKFLLNIGLFSDPHLIVWEVVVESFWTLIFLEDVGDFDVGMYLISSSYFASKEF